MKIKFIVKTKDLAMYMFCIAYTIWLSFSFLGHIELFEEKLKLLTYIAIVILCYLFILRIREYGAKTSAIAFIIIVFGIIVGLRTSDFGLVKLMLIVYTTKDIDIKKCIKFDIKLRTVLIIMVVILYYYGIAPDNIAYSSMGIRHSMGFTNVNAFGMAIAIVCLEILYLKEMKFDIKSFLLIGILLYAVNYYSRSRTAIYIILIALFFCVINTYKHNFFNNIYCKKIIIYFPFFMMILTFVLSRLYKKGNYIAAIIDLFLTGRLRSIKFYDDIEVINFIGINIKNHTTPLDNVYAYTFYGMGVIYLIIFIFSYIALLKQLIETNQYSLMIVFLIFAIYGLSERLWINIDYNIFMIAYNNILFKNLKKEKL